MATLQPTTASIGSQTRTRDALRLISLALIAVGIFVSGYLSYVELTKQSAICIEGGAFNCDVVQNSAYSKLFGIPVAYLGLATYLFLGALILLENRISILQEYGPTLVFGITLFSFIFSIWLLYVQAAILQAFCPWCLTHEIAMTLLFIVSGLRLRRSMKAT